MTTRRQDKGKTHKGKGNGKGADKGKGVNGVPMEFPESPTISGMLAEALVAWDGGETNRCKCLLRACVDSMPPDNES